ncbi:Single-stranded DNA-binding protein [Candidatus Velamenicoccus archaeovorus]|uniref:Single-stranded DNA-binding protein n=1 Tax=Velamenicoccus archaeovorus TaxID=1930593 RepID=A0A410P2N8_VELA1|nr:single-stranded DNA-binding protein [Candidatus Velamenicoccus archaeovorus]QAT16348.1 Single-stranded DNA-binding protein [Candidatus Velamenicoccus archaeovorus]
MANLNKVFLIGNLTKDPELRYTPGGTAVVNLRMATNRRFKDKTGEMKQEVCFITVVAWDKQAEVCNQYLRKGSPLFVEGRLQTRSWDGNDGKKRSVVEVRAERIQFLGQAGQKGETAAEEHVSTAEEKQAAPALGADTDDVSWGQDAAEDVS